MKKEVRKSKLKQSLIPLTKSQNNHPFLKIQPLAKQRLEIEANVDENN